MDITLLKTFLEVASSGSFVSASDRLFVTQSAVSLRIRRLEDDLGTPLFQRSKAGTVLTPAGQELERYAQSILRLWSEARQHIAIPQGFSRSISIGAQYSLWPRIGYRWIDRLQAADPGLSIRGEVGMPDRLTRNMTEGLLNAAILYTPTLRPGLAVERLSEDDLVLVAPWASPTLDLEGRYVLMDWGDDFLRSHALELPHLSSGLTLALGSLAADFLISRGYAGYLPARFAKRPVDQGVLHLVPRAPRFPFPVWVVWREDLEDPLRSVARKCLFEVAAEVDAESDEIRRKLDEISAI